MLGDLQKVLLAGDLDYISAEKLKRLKSGIEEVERILKALKKSLENKHLTPRTLESLTPRYLKDREKRGTLNVTLLTH